MITFEEATVEHGRYLAKNLRSEELDEVWTLNGDPFEAIKYSVERSVETWTLLEDGEIMSMFGVKPDYDILPPTPMGRHGLLFNKIEIRRK